ncbi:cAMP-specific 3' [Prionailurus iriomotensis]
METKYTKDQEFESQIYHELTLQVDFIEALASEETLHSSNEEEDPFRGMEPYLVRRLSCRNVQLPPLAFRQLEQADLKSESENVPRPTSLPLKILPLIAITSADSSG